MNAHNIDFELIGRSWTLHRADMEALWEKMTVELSTCVEHKTPHIRHWEDDERLPYYAELWPSSLALAKWLMLQKECIQGRQCVDMGCGLGFTSLCGAYLGARVLGVDYEEEALVMARANALINEIPIGQLGQWLIPNEAIDSGPQTGFVEFMCMDWRHPSIPKQSVDFVYAADIVYEKQFIRPILDYLDYVLKDDGSAWIAEPSRSIFEYFHSVILGSPFECQKVFSEVTDALSVNIPSARVNIWEISKIKN